MIPCLSVELTPSTLPAETIRWVRFRLLEPHVLEVFHNSLGLYRQQPKRGNSTLPGLLSLVGLNVLFPMSDPEQASKLPVSSGLIDRSLKSLASNVGFCKTLFFIVQNSNIPTTHTIWIFSLFLPLSPSHLSEHRNTLICIVSHSYF